MDGEIAEDDMVVVIIGDNDSPEVEVTIKEEPLDESEFAPIEEILETAVKHGEFIDVKQEVEDPEYDEYEALEDAESDPEIMDNESDPDYKEEEEEIKPQKKRRGPKPTKRRKDRQKRIFGPRPNWQKHKPFSYVQQLRDENPEFREDPSKLINHLSEIMRMLRPPKLPADVCTIKCEGDKVTYVCSKCEVESDSVAAGHRHYQRFHGEFYLMCYACGIKFTNSTNLYKHEKNCKARDAAVVLKARGQYLGVKGRGRPFCTDHRFRPGADPLPKSKGRHYCSKCPASFAHKENLIAHELTHAGLRPYRCDTCPAAYTSEIALKRHVQTHGEDKFTCDYCGRGFKLKPLLISHINVHRPQRKYGCPHCPQRYARPLSLRNHVNRKHLQLPHEHCCPVCPKRYARMSHVRDHMKKSHGLAMITRSMFFQNLPKMSNITLQDAKIVLKQESGGCTILPNIGSQNREEEEEEDVEEDIDDDEDEDVKPNIHGEAEELEMEYKPKVKSDKNTPKRVYQIQSNVKNKVKYEVPEDKEDDPESIDNFLRLIQNVKPGTKVVSVHKTKPKTQYLKAPELSDSEAPYQPRVKLLKQYNY